MSEVIKRFRKKPIVIDAIQWTGDNTQEVMDFVGEKSRFFPKWIIPRIVIETLEGWMHVRRNDFVIKGVKGEFYPCKPDIFAETYDEVKE